MKHWQEHFKTKFTSNTRTVAAFTALCIAAYGLTLLNWLETTAQKSISVEPRDQVPDFLVSNSRFTSLRGPKDSTEREAVTVGTHRISIQSVTLTHFTDTATTHFEYPFIEMNDYQDHTWVMTANKAAGQDITNGQVELTDNVTLTSLSEQLTLTTDRLNILINDRIIKTHTPVEIVYGNGTIKAGSFEANLEHKQVKLGNGVNGIYQP